MKTKLITREGYNKLKEELDFLWREERPDTTRKLSLAASLGDQRRVAFYRLPSTSPANASWSFERKLAAWREVFEAHGVM